MKELKIELREIKSDGLPSDEEKLRCAFIFDGNIISGWPLNGIENHTENEWESDSDVGRMGIFNGIKHYIVFQNPIWEIV